MFERLGLAVSTQSDVGLGKLEFSVLS